MVEAHKPPRFTRFGVFEVDLCTGELRKCGLRVKLQEQPFQVLAMLLDRPGHVVTREEIQTKLWPRGTVVEFEHSINAAVLRLRDALGDSADNPRFIETLPRRGYRFIHPVAAAQAVTPAPSPAGIGERESGLDSQPSPGGERVSRPAGEGAGVRLYSARWLATLTTGVIVAVVALLALNITGLRERLFRMAAPAPKIESIAVLPLENLSGDPAQEYFADGMTDALITELGQISALRVISRTSVMQYKATRKPVPEIARELNVDALVEGSVLRSGERVRVNAQLVQARPERHLWSESFEHDLSDVLTLQGNVSRAIAREIGIAVTPHEQVRLAGGRTVTHEAYEAYVRGRYLWNTRSEEGVRRGLEYFQQAIEIDPGYALAHAGLADSYLVLADIGVLAPSEAHEKARLAAVKALQLDHDLAEAHASFAMVMFSEDWDWAGAEKGFKRALELNPSYATARQWYAFYLSSMGRHEEAIKEAKRAHDLDPLSVVINVSLAESYLRARQYDQALEECNKIVELDTEGLSHHCLAMGYQAKGLFAEAFSELEKARFLTLPHRLTDLAILYALTGEREEALKMLGKLHDASKKEHVSPTFFAIVYAGLGENDKAIQWLEKAFDSRDHELLMATTAWYYDALRSDPRFQNLLRRMNFPRRSDPFSDLGSNRSVSSWVEAWFSGRYDRHF